MGAGEGGSTSHLLVFVDAFLVSLLGQCTLHVFASAQIYGSVSNLVNRPNQLQHMVSLNFACRCKLCSPSLQTKLPYLDVETT